MSKNYLLLVTEEVLSECVVEAESREHAIEQFYNGMHSEFITDSCETINVTVIDEDDE